jgi:DNA replication protein DnaC
LRAVSAVSGQSAVQHLTFDTFMPDGHGLPPDKAENLRRAHHAALLFATDPQGWLLLTGAYGCGKTHLAAAIVNEAIARGHAALFLTTPDLLDHLRASFNPESDLPYDSLFDRIREAPLLVLDDLGAQSSTAWAQEKLFQLLNHRYNRRLPTVVTTNQRLEDIEPRIRSRLQDVELVQRIAILAPDFRSGATTIQGDLITLGLHRTQRFDNFDLQRSDLSQEERVNLQMAYDAARGFAASPAGWLVLAGPNGCGKTHLAAAIANDRVQSDVMFVAVPDLLDYLRASFSPQSTVSFDRRFDEIRRAPILILDYLSTESATPWAREKLFQLLSFRFDAQLPTVITTIQEKKSLDPWLSTRIFDSTHSRFCGIVAAGYPGSSSQKQSSRSTGRLTRRP